MQEFIPYLQKRNTIQLLELISFVQLFPENHGKNLRLEIIQSHILNNLDKLTDDFNYDGTVNAIQDFFPHDYREDPPETSFTENFLFLNGNNIVFPGIVIDSTLILQKICHIVLFENNKVPHTVKKKIANAMFFMLDIYNHMAIMNGLERYMKPICEETELYFPEEETFQRRKEAISFSKDEINAIYEKYKIDEDIINEFLFDWENNTIDVNDYDKNPLLFKPFIKYENKYYLVIPTSQMYALDNFLIKMLEAHDCLEEIIDLFDSDIIRDTKIELAKMGWSKTDVGEKVRALKGELFWQFDENKMAYINVLSNQGNNVEIEDRTNKVLSKVKKTINDNNYQYFVVIIMSTYTSLEPQLLQLKHIDEADNIVVTNIFDLKRITSNWDLDKLSLWKYAKSFKMAQDRDFVIGPGYSILTYYSYYEGNQGSFFRSDEAYGGIFFDLSIQGNIIIDNNLRTDRHGVLRYMEGKGVGYTPVFKTDTYGPIYLSEELFFGEYKKVFTGFGFPIWVGEHNPASSYTRHFVDAVVFWLNELSQSKYISYEFNGPLEISIFISDNFFNLEYQRKNEDNETEGITYELKPQAGKIIVTIPDTFHILLHRKDNFGERELMKVILESISKIIQLFKKPTLTKKQIICGIEDSIPLGPAKMILTATSQHNLLIDNTHLPNVRYIPKSDGSFVLEHVLKWLDYREEIPNEIPNKEGKIKILVDCVNAIIREIRTELKKFNTFELLKFLLYKNEAVVQYQEYGKIYIPARAACFSKYKDINEEYQQAEDNIVNVSLALRCLVEFVHAEPFHGNKLPNDDDVDYLLALIHQMIYFGTVQDSIRFDIDDPKIGVLPSGRLGISKDFYTTIMSDYNSSNRQDELLDYVDNFHDNFSNTENTETKSETSRYDIKIDKAFIKEWGITLPEIYSISHFLAEYCLLQQKSFCYLTRRELVDLIFKESTFNKQKIDAYLDAVTLTSRGKIDKAPKGYKMPEIFPWRYNRKLSYLKKPLLKIEAPGQEAVYLWSARFIVKSARNLFYQFSNATLRIDSDNHRIKNLIAQRNNLKGKEYRNSVFQWMQENTKLLVIPFEVKIDVKGTLKADKNYGDVDILAIDEHKRIIYSIECKNTRQVKIMYDFQRDLKNYIHKQLPKHARRHKWLNENQNKVIQKFNIRNGNHKVISLIISSYQLPVKFLNHTGLPIYSFNEIKRSNIFG